MPDFLEELAVQELVGRVGGLLAARAAAGRRSHPRGVGLAVGFACSARFLAKIAPKHLIWVG